ncbi:plasmid maintenance protein [Candidatus Borreliella tachyglossi]|uniref:plasmid maintenance protein n=1 Tax=Candidatus Borreliella tachyglossi TaxID=1964448 RepID=UPI00404168DB
MIYQKRHFFKNSTKDKEALLTRIINTSLKSASYSKSVTIGYVKSQVVKKQNMIKRLLKICWAIGIKNHEYYKSGRLKHYSAGDIHNIVNHSLKHDSLKTCATSTLRKDIQLLNKLKIITSVNQPLGEGNGGFVYYKINPKNWQDYKTIIRDHYEDEIINYFADKKIKGSFEDKIDSITFDDIQEADYLERIEQNAEELSNVALQNSDLISNDIISSIKLKNSKKNSNSKNQDVHTTNNTVDSAKPINEGYNNKPRKYKDYKTRLVKEAYKKTYEEYMEVKLESQYRVNKHTIAKIKLHSNNVATYRNALRNLESGLTAYHRNYLVNDISEHFASEFIGGYKDKIWMMNRNTDKTNDFFKIWGKFTDTYTNKYKQQLSRPQETYDDGLGAQFKVDNSGRFIKGGFRRASDILGI